MSQLVRDSMLDLYSVLGSAVSDLTHAAGPVYADYRTLGRHAPARESELISARRNVQRAVDAARRVLESAEKASAAIDAELAPEPQNPVAAAAPTLVRCIPRLVDRPASIPVVKSSGAMGVVPPSGGDAA